MRLLRDLRDIDAAFRQKYRRPLFTTIEGRDKKEKSFFRKLYQICQERGRTTGITQNTLIASYETINDLCGARFACPYWDDVLMAVNDVVRPRLGDLGYAVDLRGEHDDKNYLENGSEAGYRSYHFFVRIPTPVNIYGDVEHCLCEMQARTELQNVWAVKSHDLLYKPDSGLDLTDRHVVEDMRQASNHLRAIDQLFMSIRDRARGE
jgi:ppGpp synthetase/RelA/SpoT-type nucleotidyltranferase